MGLPRQRRGGRGIRDVVRTPTARVLPWRRDTATEDQTTDTRLQAGEDPAAFVSWSILARQCRMEPAQGRRSGSGRNDAAQWRATRVCRYGARRQAHLASAGGADHGAVAAQAIALS